MFGRQLRLFGVSLPALKKYQINLFYDDTKHVDYPGCWHYRLYPSYWTDKLKNTIRKRDSWKCQMCGRQWTPEENKGGIGLDIHHIDYNKWNCNPANLISLCHSPCHTRTNLGRAGWIIFFKVLLGGRHD